MGEESGGADDADASGETDVVEGTDAAEGTDASEGGGRPCPRCDRPMYRRHCKYVCPEHGVVFDCSDTFY